MARFISLQLVSDNGSPVQWPGVATDFQIGGDPLATAVWIGVSEDGATNQVYPLSTAPTAILQSWAHLYQGVQIGNDVYYVSLEEYHRLVAACCVAVAVEDSPSPAPCMVTINYNYEAAGPGSFLLDVNGVTLVNVTDENAVGSLQVAEGSEVTAVAQSDADYDIQLIRDPGGDDELLDNCAGTTGGCQVLLAAAQCGEVYQINAVTSLTPP